MRSVPHLVDLGRRDNYGDVMADVRTVDPIWEEALDIISQQINEGTFRIWFEQTVGLGLIDDTYSVGVASEFIGWCFSLKCSFGLELRRPLPQTGRLFLGEEVGIALRH